MSLSSNLASLARLLTAAASGIVNGKAPAAGDSSTALITSAWFKGEQAAEATQGTAKVATQAQANAGTDDATIVTPKKLRAGFAISLSATGYIAFPAWLGGLIIQWGSATTVSGGNATWILPLAFPNNQIFGCAMLVGSGLYAVTNVNYSKTSPIFNCSNSGGGVTGVSLSTFAIGW